MTRSVLLSSNCNVWREPFNGQAHALLNVISGAQDADIADPARLGASLEEHPVGAWHGADVSARSASGKACDDGRGVR